MKISLIAKLAVKILHFISLNLSTKQNWLICNIRVKLLFL